MREGTLEMRERGVQMRHFRAIAQDLEALNCCVTKLDLFRMFSHFESTRN